MSATFVPTQCDYAQISAGMIALLEAVGCKNITPNDIYSIEVREGVLYLEMLPHNAAGDPIVVGKEAASTVSAEIKVGL